MENINDFITFNKPYLIIVDDDEDDLELVNDIFNELQLNDRILTLTSGDDLLSFLNKTNSPGMPSLIVLDINMPRLNGLSLLGLLREDKKYNKIPVALYSTTLSSELEKELMAAGATYCHQKPTNMESFRQLMVEFYSIADPAYKIEKGFISEKIRSK